MVSPLLAERRRHWRTSFGLTVAALAAGVAVSNERGVFMPIWGVDDAIAATARAFAAVAAPEPMQVDSLYTPPTTLHRITTAPSYRRIVDVPGFTPPVMPSFEPASGFEPASIGAVAVSAPDLSSPVSFAALNTPTPVVPAGVTQVQGVPEPASWTLMIGGFGLVGALQRVLGRARRGRQFA
ncbi:PEPxxWA-CTERM sorting domain-containing protein [Sphingomonas nostoxanthinifaciens]|uniref:PEPxxWA-CTERM sorting domain-containing protein n=1 Tax=Sphingomonas nostoxanthinifaciens TaxID=2872652 RepID=UPI001CC1D47E|nr:PEPxxWA-CTERM sorting domain-containing protein [Sphingomonas nostoxanthinifaciens]UAK25426.1 PEPxxWA-CTERM sorting domain-containing protein [Sphingomonas nostoxanthinifaciens]